MAIYSNYPALNVDHPLKMYDDAFYNKIVGDDGKGPSSASGWFLMVASVSAMFTKTVQELHNKLADEAPSFEKSLKTWGVELAFMATLISSIVETIARVVWEVVLAILEVIALPIAAMCGGRSVDFVLSPLIANSQGIAITGYHIGQNAISLYTNIAHQNEKIDYNGQARCHLLGQTPV